MVKNLNCKKKIIIDFDDTIYESIFVYRINEFLGTNYKIEDFKDYLLDDVVPKDKKKDFYKFLVKTDLYGEDLIISDAIEVIEKLNKVYDVYICSGCVMFNCPEESAPVFMYKYRCLLRNFPFLSPFKFIFTQSKDLVDADIIIDDNPDYLKKDRETKILFDSYHNGELTDEYLKENNIIRAKSWKEIKNILLK